MKKYDKLIKESVIDDFLDSINCRNGTFVSADNVSSLKTIIAAMEKMLTPAQFFQLVNTDAVQKALHQDNSPAAARGCVGTLGGFGTEELEEWQRMVHWPTP